MSLLPECVNWWLTAVFLKGRFINHLHQKHLGQLLKNKDTWILLQTSWIRISQDGPQILHFNHISQIHVESENHWSCSFDVAYDFFFFTISTKIYTAIPFYKAHLHISCYFIFTIILWDITIQILQISTLSLKTFKQLCPIVPIQVAALGIEIGSLNFKFSAVSIKVCLLPLSVYLEIR